MNTKKKFLFLLLTSSIGFMNVRADQFTTEGFRMSKLGNVLGCSVGFPFGIFLYNKLPHSLCGLMALNKSELKGHLLRAVAMGAITDAISFWCLEKCLDRNNIYHNIARGAIYSVMLAIATQGCIEHRGEKTGEYKNAANRLYGLFERRKDLSQQEVSEMHQLLKKLAVTKDTPKEDVYPLEVEGYNKSFMLRPLQNEDGSPCYYLESTDRKVIIGVSIK